MTAPILPLAAAAVRLRGEPGRPSRKGTGRAQDSAATRVNGGLPSGTHDSESGRPERQRAPINQRRLLGVKETADYLSIGEDGVREMAASPTGLLKRARVEIPGNTRVLFDREELDRLVTGWRVAGD